MRTLDTVDDVVGSMVDEIEALVEPKEVDVDMVNSNLVDCQKGDLVLIHLL